MAKILCVLYDDPVDGYPKTYARDDLPKVERYPGGQTAPTPKGIDFKPGELLGSVSGALGLRKFLEDLGHTLVVTSDKEGPNSVFERELPDAEIVISQPFWPAYLTPERIAKAKKLKLAITAGIGSDHVDLPAAIKHGVNVAEVTFSNSMTHLGGTRESDRFPVHKDMKTTREGSIDGSASHNPAVPSSCLSSNVYAKSVIRGVKASSCPKSLPNHFSILTFRTKFARAPFFVRAKYKLLT